MENSLLAALAPEDLARITPALSLLNLERGRALYEPGDRIDVVYFPLDGVISLMALMENGAAIEAATIGREGAVGLRAAASPMTSIGRAIVQTPCRAFRIGQPLLQEVFNRSPSVRDLVYRHTSALFAQLIQGAACNALHSVEARFSRWLLSCHDRVASDTIALTQEFLADMLGVQRTTVTAVARGLQAKGAIRYRRGVVDIVSRPALEAATCECYRAVRGAYERLLPVKF